MDIIELKNCQVTVDDAQHAHVSFYIPPVSNYWQQKDIDQGKFYVYIEIPVSELGTGLFPPTPFHTFKKEIHITHTGWHHVNLSHSYLISGDIMDEGYWRYYWDITLFRKDLEKIDGISSCTIWTIPGYDDVACWDWCRGKRLKKLVGDWDLIIDEEEQIWCNLYGNYWYDGDCHFSPEQPYIGPIDFGEEIPAPIFVPAPIDIYFPEEETKESFPWWIVLVTGGVMLYGYTRRLI